jgi:hypothetical protein
MRWTVYVAHMRKVRNAYKVVIGKPNGKSPVVRPRCRREDDVKLHLKEFGNEGLTGYIWLKIWTSGRLLRTRNDSSKSVEGEKNVNNRIRVSLLRKTHGVGWLAS